MQRTRAPLVLLCLLALASAACSKAKDTGFPPLPTGSESAEVPCVAGSDEPTEVTGPILVVDSAFAPIKGKVAAGTSVEWSQCGTAPHTVTSATGSTVKFDSHPDCPADTARCMGKGDTFSFTFAAPGSYAYYCKIHGTPDGRSGMAGVIVVE